jgi:hypothetical protein
LRPSAGEDQAVRHVLRPLIGKTSIVSPDYGVAPAVAARQPPYAASGKIDDPPGVEQVLGDLAARVSGADD